MVGWVISLMPGNVARENAEEEGRVQVGWKLSSAEGWHLRSTMCASACLFGAEVKE